MYISKLKLKNFKGFKGEYEIEFSEKMNFFVGDNNCGKTTIFHAIDFLVNGGSKEDFITKGVENDELYVEVDIKGSELENFINNSEDSNLRKYSSGIIDNNDGTSSIKIRRSSESGEIKKIKIYLPESDAYKNVAGVDKAMKMVFDPLVIYSDIDNNESRDFGKTKTLGKLIGSVMSEFKDSDSWKSLENAHRNAFQDQDFKKKIGDLESKLDDTLAAQYGEAKVKINFEFPEIDIFSKSGGLRLLDNGVDTDISDKGTGLQRALALALLQVYATVSNGNSNKPTFFFIDEPETFLHPKAQDKLIEALDKISENNQVFVTTHSPYLLKKFNKNKHDLLIFKKKDSANSAPEKAEVLDLFGEHSPSWGEINYFAFDVASIEFHNELYGFLQEKAISEDAKCENIKKFDKWLLEHGQQQEKKYSILKNGNPQEPFDTTIQTYIRHKINHPENTHNDVFTKNELRTSIERMIELCRSIDQSTH